MSCGLGPGPGVVGTDEEFEEADGVSTTHILSRYEHGAVETYERMLTYGLL